MRRHCMHVALTSCNMCGAFPLHGQPSPREGELRPALGPWRAARHFLRKFLLFFFCGVTPSKILAAPQPLNIAFPLGNGGVLRSEEGGGFRKEGDGGEGEKKGKKDAQKVLRYLGVTKYPDGTFGPENHIWRPPLIPHRHSPGLSPPLTERTDPCPLPGASDSPFPPSSKKKKS